MPLSYPWYQKIKKKNTSLQQGDLIRDCPIVLPPQNLHPNHEYEFEVEMFDVVVMSQSCDLEQGKVDNVLVCPFYSFKEFGKKGNWKESDYKSNYKNISEARQYGYHLLNKEEEMDLDDYLVVDFRNVYSVHIQFLQEHLKTLKNRIRLLPPYREHLAQAFARFFMRVGLPQNITPWGE